MTTLSQARTIPLRRRVPTVASRRIVATIVQLPRWLGVQVLGIAHAGQLGPNPETESGRRTGARV